MEAAVVQGRAGKAEACLNPVAAPEAYLLSNSGFDLTYGLMTDANEKRLIEALRKVDMHGDIAPPHVQDPMTMVLRQRAILSDLMRWDDIRGQFVLTGTGRNRISGRNQPAGSVVRFRKRDSRDESTPHQKNQPTGKSR